MLKFIKLMLKCIFFFFFLNTGRLSKRDYLKQDEETQLN